LSEIGIDPSPRNPHRVVGDEARWLGEVRAFTSDLGKTAERVVTGLYAGILHPEASKMLLLKSILYVQESLRVERGEGLLEGSMLAPEQRVAHPKGNLVDGTLGLGNENLHNVMEVVDRTCGTDFLGTYLSLIKSVGGEVYPDVKVKYLTEAALAISKELVRQSYIRNGFIVPDLKLYDSSNTLVTQIDAINFQTAPQLITSYEDYFVSGVNYGFLSIKMPFRDRHITGARQLRSPRREDRVQSQQQMATHALALYGKGAQKNLLPRYVDYIYLRGSHDTRVMREEIDLTYVNRWWIICIKLVAFGRTAIFGWVGKVIIE